MQIPFVDLKRQYKNHKAEIDQAIADVISSASFIGGVTLENFEEAFAKKQAVKHCIGVNSGTDALYIILKILGIGIGDEVITTASSWVATASTISQTGAQPVFVDIKDDFLIDETLIESKITDKTKAIIPVHLFGQMADIITIHDICSKHKLLLIEDSAQTHFSERDHNKVGQLSSASIFSFHPSKNLGAYGNGGAIITNDHLLANQCRKYANHGGLTKHEHQVIGINSKLNNMQASILSKKLKHVDIWVKQRRSIANKYFELLADIKEIQLPIVHEDAYHVYHVFCIRADRRDELASYLKEKGIGTALHYPTPLPFLECYQDLRHKPEDFPIAHQLSKRILSLPMFPEMRMDEVAYVCDQIKAFYS